MSHQGGMYSPSSPSQWPIHLGSTRRFPSLRSRISQYAVWFVQFIPYLTQGLQLIAQWVLRCYDTNPDLQSLLKGFVDNSDFEISLDDGSKAITVQPELLPHLKDGTKLVMSVVTFRRVSHKRKSVPCPSCNRSIPIHASAQSGTQERVFWYVNLY
jgi:hypothetical protein